MKKILFLLIIILGFNKSNASIQTWFSILSQSGNNYQFHIVSWISLGNGTNCPNLYSTPDQLSNDTIYIRQLYDLNGIWQSFGCFANDTVNFVNIYPNANYVNLSIGFYQLNSNNINDTLWNYHDTTYQLNPLQIQHGKHSNRMYQLFPNPNNGYFTIDNDIHNGEPIEILIYDVIGKLVYSSKTSTLPFQVALPNLQKGIYFISLIDRDKLEQQMEKIIIRD